MYVTADKVTVIANSTYRWEVHVTVGDQFYKFHYTPPRPTVEGGVVSYFTLNGREIMATRYPAKHKFQVIWKEVDALLKSPEGAALLAGKEEEAAGFAALQAERAKREMVQRATQRYGIEILDFLKASEDPKAKELMEKINNYLRGK